MSRRRKGMSREEALQRSAQMQQMFAMLHQAQQQEKRAEAEELESGQRLIREDEERDYRMAQDRQAQGIQEGRLALDREKFEAERGDKARLAAEKESLGEFVDDSRVSLYEDLSKKYREASIEAATSDLYGALSGAQEKLFRRNMKRLGGFGPMDRYMRGAVESKMFDEGGRPRAEYIPLIRQALDQTYQELRAELPEGTTERMENLILGSTKNLLRQVDEIDGKLRSFQYQRNKPMAAGMFGDPAKAKAERDAAIDQAEQALMQSAPAMKFIPWTGDDANSLPDFLSFMKTERPGLTSDRTIRDLADRRIQNIVGRIDPGISLADIKGLDAFPTRPGEAGSPEEMGFPPEEMEGGEAMPTSVPQDGAAGRMAQSFGSQMFERAGRVLDRGMTKDKTSFGTKMFGRQGPVGMFDEDMQAGDMPQEDVQGPGRSHTPMADAIGRNVLNPIQEFMQGLQPPPQGSTIVGLGAHGLRDVAAQLPLHLLGGGVALGEMAQRPVGDALSQFLGPYSSAMAGSSPQPSQVSPMSMMMPSAGAANRGMMGQPDMIGARQVPMRTPISGMPPVHPGPMEHAPPPHSEVMDTDPVFMDSFMRGMGYGEPVRPGPTPSGQALHDEMRPMGTAAQALMRVAAMRAMNEPLPQVDQAGFLQSLLGGMGGY